MRYPIVFWDIDGTIFFGEDPTDGCGNCPSLQEIKQNGPARAEQILRMFGHTPPSDLANVMAALESELRDRHGPRYSLEILARQLYETLGISERREESLYLADAIWGPRYQGWLFEGCREALATMHQAGARMGVITNNAATGRMMRNALTGVGLINFFGPVICSCDVGAQKPSPEIFNTALTNLPPPPTPNQEAVLYVGDNPIADIEGAVACGWNAALHLTGPDVEPAANDAVLTFSNYQELVELVLGTSI